MARTIRLEVTPGQLRALNSALALWMTTYEGGDDNGTIHHKEAEAGERVWRNVVQAAMVQHGVRP